MNLNTIRQDGFSNPDSEQLYKNGWPDEPHLAEQCEDGGQCGACSFYAPFNDDWGLCCNSKSQHHLETVFEHFTCPALARESWGSHSFTSDERAFCRCGSYTPLPPQTDLICLMVKTEGDNGVRVRVTLEVNSQFTAQDSSLYFALEAVQKQVEQALRQISSPGD